MPPTRSQKTRKRRRTRRQGQSRRQGGWNQTKNAIVALRQNLVQKTQQEKQWIDHLVSLLKKPEIDDTILLHKAANQLLFLPLTNNATPMAQYRTANRLRLEWLNVIANTRIYRNHIIHTLARLRNQNAKNIANYAKIIANLPLSRNHSPSTIGVKTQDIKERLAKWKEGELSQPKSSAIDVITSQYDDLLQKHEKDTFELDIDANQVADVTEWILGGMGLIYIMKSMLESSAESTIQQRGTILTTYRVVYFVAKGLATRLKKITDRIVSDRDGTVTKENQRPCMIANQRAALLFYEWMQYQVAIGAPGASVAKVKEAEKKQALAKLGCISLDFVPRK